MLLARPVARPEIGELATGQPLKQTSPGGTFKSVVKDVSFTTIFKGVLPFVATDIVRLVILIAFPIIALWLPSRM